MEALMNVLLAVVEFCLAVTLVVTPIVVVLYGGLWIDKKTGWFSKFADEVFGMGEPNKK